MRRSSFVAERARTSVVLRMGLHQLRELHLERRLVQRALLRCGLELAEPARSLRLVSSLAFSGCAIPCDTPGACNSIMPADRVSAVERQSA